MNIGCVKRALGPSFFVCLGITFCVFVAASHDYLGLWLGICCLLITWVISPDTNKKHSFPALAFISLFLLKLLNLLTLNSHGFPVAYFIVTYGLLGFIVFSVLNKNNILSIFRILIVIFSLLSIWSLAQYIFSIGELVPHRVASSVIFANPNSYAALINLILFPLVTFYVVKKNNKKNLIYFVILLLFSSLITTQSRGAWVAFIVGLSSLVAFLVVIKSQGKTVLLKRLILGFIITFVLVTSSKFFALSLPSLNSSIENNSIDILEDNLKSTVANKSKASLKKRKELVLIAWKNIKENIFFGVGYYNTIYYYYKDVTDNVYTKTHYIHNDYMQMWLELGLLGIVFSLSIVIASYWQGIQSFNNATDDDRLWTVAILSGLTTIFTHALVSYLFYVPVLICLVSGYIAILNNILAKYNNIFLINIGFNNVVTKKVVCVKTWQKRLIISLLILIYLFSFVFAQISYRAGKSMLSEGNVEHASTLFKLARDLNPAEVENYLVEAAFWKNKAFDENSTQAATRADVLYEQLMFQNKYDADSRLHRAILHRDGNMLLNNPASKEIILAWFEEALKWRPHHNILQSEYLRTLKMYGKGDEARILLTTYLKKYPNSKSLTSINEEIMN
ncbi:MAG: O-antigen ligase family protein [Gammaproteobacteria bacterium]|jgi:O-antigen ligase